MRDVDPFGYWHNHASAIAGLGGAERSPDPRYLFHTDYLAVRAGPARFVVRLRDAKASFGELAIRVHAWKPESDRNISLVSGARMLLDGQDAAEAALPVHFAAQKDVLYALYGYLSEDSDIVAQSLAVGIEEPEATGDHDPEPPRSVLATLAEPGEARPANALLHYGLTETANPVSQSCTREQVAALGLLKAGFLRARRDENDGMAAIALWCEALCVNALAAYGAVDSGLEGLVVGAVSPGYVQQLAQSASVAWVDGTVVPPRSDSVFFDFLLMPGGLDAGVDVVSDPHARWAAIGDWLARLKIGGLAVLGLRYRADDDVVSSAAVADGRTLSRNEIGQWALRLIGSGYSVAPLAFAPAAELVVDDQGLAGFLLIVQRSRP